jgi:anthranilate synthase/aminodeoxychorismate synthase-like glutamine amidotransferase
MLIMIDNYDSFTYNLVQYLGELGQGIRVFRNDQTTVEEVEALSPDRIVLSPGPRTPKEAGISNDIIRRFAGRVPLLGVCLDDSARRKDNLQGPSQPLRSDAVPLPDHRAGDNP